MKSKDQKRKEALARWEVRKADCVRLKWPGREKVADAQIARLRQILNITVAA